MIKDDNEPVFLQIKSWIENKILKDEWKCGTQLPSVRELSVDFSVNPNTIVRTYERLLLDNTIYSIRGVGYFVANNVKGNIMRKRREIFYKNTLPLFINQVDVLGIDISEVIDYYNKIKKEGVK